MIMQKFGQIPLIQSRSQAITHVINLHITLELININAYMQNVVQFH